LRTSGRMPGGRSRSTVAIFSLMSRAAWADVDLEVELRDHQRHASVEVRSRIEALIVLTASSIFCVMSDSTASGDAPGYGRDDRDQRKSILGTCRRRGCVPDHADDDEGEDQHGGEDRRRTES